MCMFKYIFVCMYFVCFKCSCMSVCANMFMLMYTCDCASMALCMHEVCGLVCVCVLQAYIFYLSYIGV